MKYLVLIFSLVVLTLLVLPESKIGYRFRVATVDGKVEITDCQQVPDLLTYLTKLNETLNPQDRSCEIIDSQLSFTTIECSVVNGPSEMILYWSHELTACQYVRKSLGGS